MTEEAQSDFPTAWRPEPGDTVTGTLLNVEAIDPNGNGVYPVVTLKTDGGDIAVHAFHTVLRRELARRRPKVGDELTIVYQGKRPGGKNNEYHAYRVSGGSGGEYDWSQDLPPDERPPSGPPIQSAPVPQQAQPAGAQFGDSPPF